MSTAAPITDSGSDSVELPNSWDASVPDNWEQEQLTQHLRSQFQIVRELGRGGMGVVFLCRDIALHRLVAVKVLRFEYATSVDHRERFRREARMTARLSHAHIVPVHTFGEVGDLVYIVMKYVHGESLDERIRRDGALGERDARRMLRQIADALDHAHAEGVIHRDLKAENILIERGTNRAMITDFGVALSLRSYEPGRARSRRAFGTPHYMSPEQAAGEADLDGRSDIYSLGVLGYYMLAGRLPFEGVTFEALAAQHIVAEHVPLVHRAPRVAARLCDAVERCLRKLRDERWRYARDFAMALGDDARRWGWFTRAA
jgi:serine/threonine-protein kinase